MVQVYHQHRLHLNLHLLYLRLNHTLCSYNLSHSEFMRPWLCFTAHDFKVKHLIKCATAGWFQLPSIVGINNKSINKCIFKQALFRLVCSCLTLIRSKDQDSSDSAWNLAQHRYTLKQRWPLGSDWCRKRSSDILYSHNMRRESCHWETNMTVAVIGRLNPGKYQHLYRLVSVICLYVSVIF